MKQIAQCNLSVHWVTLGVHKAIIVQMYKNVDSCQKTSFVYWVYSDLKKLNTNQWLRMNSRKIICTDQNYTFLHITFKLGEKR